MIKDEEEINKDENIDNTINEMQVYDIPRLGNINSDYKTVDSFGFISLLDTKHIVNVLPSDTHREDVIEVDNVHEKEYQSILCLGCTPKPALMYILSHIMQVKYDAYCDYKNNTKDNNSNAIVLRPWQRITPYMEDKESLGEFIAEEWIRSYNTIIKNNIHKQLLRILCNGTHWLTALITLTRNQETKTYNTLVTIIGTTQQAKNLSYEEILNEFTDLFEETIQIAYTTYTKEYKNIIHDWITSICTIEYSQCLQYGNMGCMLATGLNGILVQTKRFPLEKHIVQSNDRIEIDDGMMVAIEKDGDIYTKVITIEEYNVINSILLENEILIDAGIHRIVNAFQDRSWRINKQDEILYRVELYIEMNKRRKLLKEIIIKKSNRNKLLE